MILKADKKLFKLTFKSFSTFKYHLIVHHLQFNFILELHFRIKRDLVR